MKKKLISLLLALAVILSSSMTAMAADVNNFGSVPDDPNSASSDLGSTLGVGLSLDQSTVAVKAGETAQLTASLYGASPAVVAWSSSDTSIATVDSNGVVTGRSLGIATITATSDSGLTATCTAHVVIKGIDVSHHQSSIDWNAVKSSGIDFALIKATEGVDYLDPNFTSYVTGAAAAGLHVGAYHFLRVGSTADQAQDFLAAIRPYPLSWPVAVDVENPANSTELSDLGRDKITDMVVDFCSRISAAGYRPLIYSNANWVRNYLDTSRLSGYDFWFARYNSTLNYSGVCTLGIWQYASDASVPGISGNVDADYAYRDYAANTPLRSDTTKPYTFGTNTTYCYKITTALSTAPKAVSSNPSAVSVAFYQKTTGGYLYKITNVNAGTALITTTASDGSSASFSATGKARGLISDTPAAFSMKVGATYQFKFTLVGGATGTPIIASGNSGVLSIVSKVKIGNSYYVKVRARNRGGVGLYTSMPGLPGVRQCVITVV